MSLARVRVVDKGHGTAADAQVRNFARRGSHDVSTLTFLNGRLHVSPSPTEPPTGASTEASTDRVPGRTWTVRLTGHADRTVTVSCSTTACTMPPRSRDVAGLRRFAALHAASHAKIARVRERASCQCSARSCAAHEGTRVHCSGATVLVLRHDPAVGRVWQLAEVCAACAKLMTHTRVVGLPTPVPSRDRSAPPAGAGRPEQAGQRVPAPPAPSASGAMPVAVGFSSPTAVGGDDGGGPRRAPGQLRRDRRGRAPREGRRHR